MFLCDIIILTFICNSKCILFLSELLAKFGINTKRCPKDILADLRVCFREETEDSEDDSSKPVSSRYVEERHPLRLSGMQR